MLMADDVLLFQQSQLLTTKANHPSCSQKKVKQLAWTVNSVTAFTAKPWSASGVVKHGFDCRGVHQSIDSSLPFETSVFNSLNSWKNSRLLLQRMEPIKDARNHTHTSQSWMPESSPRCLWGAWHVPLLAPVVDCATQVKKTGSWIYK